MAFQNLALLWVAVPALVTLLWLRVWRRRFWGHSLVEQFGEEIGAAHPIWRLPRLLEASALGFLLVALLGPIYPFSINRVERGGLQVMFVLDLSQSMEEPLKKGPAPASPAPLPPVPAILASSRGQSEGFPPTMLGTPGSRMEAIKKGALDFVAKRPGDAFGLVIFSNHAYLVTPPTFDHESMSQYLLMTDTDTLVNEGYTGIGEGLGAANRYFDQQKELSGRRTGRGQVIVLFTDGDNNTGRDPMEEVERAREKGTRIYMLGVELHSEASAEIASAIESTGGKYYDVSRTTDLEHALTDINEVEKGIFYTLSLTRNRPAYFVFVLLSLACLALRLMLNAFPQFVEIS